MKKVFSLVIVLLFALSLMAQSAAPATQAAPKSDDKAKACACCADKAKCEDCCKNGCKDCKDASGKMMECCKGKDGKMACERGKDGKMACCEGMKDGKMAKGCCGGKCDRMGHGAKAGM